MPPLMNSKIDTYVAKEREREKYRKRYLSYNTDLRIRARKRLEYELTACIRRLETERLQFMGEHSSLIENKITSELKRTWKMTKDK